MCSKASISTSKRGEILGFVGASGAGKSVLLRTMIGLIKPASGTIKLFGHELDQGRSESASS